MKSVEKVELPEVSPGSSRSFYVIRYGPSGAGPKVYIQAGLHADEAPGYVVAHHLEALLDKEKILGEIVLVPMANPIGLNQWRDDTLQGRFDFSNSINFNRDHLDIVPRVAKQIENRLTNSSKANIELIREESKKIIDEFPEETATLFLKKRLLRLAHDSDIVLDLHCDHEAIMHLYLGTPLWPGAEDLAADLGIKISLLAKNSGGDPFDEACSRLWWELAERFPNYPIPPACLSATVELRGSCDTENSNSRTDAQNIINFLKRRSVIEGNPPPLPSLLKGPTPLTGVDYVKAQSPGILSFQKNIGEYVTEGDVIATIINPHQENRTGVISEITSRTNGILFTRIKDRFATPGRIIAKIAGEKPLTGEEGNLLTI